MNVDVHQFEKNLYSLYHSCKDCHWSGYSDTVVAIGLDIRRHQYNPIQ